jgi:hypothetical protein
MLADGDSVIPSGDPWHGEAPREHEDGPHDPFVLLDPVPPGTLDADSVQKSPEEDIDAWVLREELTECCCVL